MDSPQSESVGFEGPPTQDFTTAGLLMDFADVKVSLTLRDGEVITGVLRSYDEFGSLVIQDAVERIHFKQRYGERKLGTWIVKGESVALLGKIEPDRDTHNEQFLAEEWTRVDFEVLQQEMEAHRKQFEEKKLEQARLGLKKGLVGSTLTSNPFRFGSN